jgi:predicted nucleic-acid-binding Zn-ribbon protein
MFIDFRFFHPTCEKCKDGKIYHNRSEQQNFTWIEVYKCDKCGEEFV